jgi:hypothetical protein
MSESLLESKVGTQTHDKAGHETVTLWLRERYAPSTIGAQDGDAQDGVAGLTSTSVTVAPHGGIL